MKKLLAISLLAMMALSFVGCQNNSSGNTSEAEHSSDSYVIVSSAKSQTDDSGESSVQSVAESIAENSGSDNAFDFINFKSNEIFDIEKVDLLWGDSSSRAILENKCETYEFRYTCDGYEIIAYISIPTDTIKSGKPRKCILFARGGHWNYGSVEPDYLASMSAVSDRIVVACEIRGGNGVEGIDEFGGDEMHDVYKLIDLCDKEFDFVNMDDFCIIGGSRGGITTYMAARNDKRVKRIVVAGGVSDLISVYNEREDMREMLCGCIGGTPEEKPEEYKKRSALYWADEIKIPVLIIHSKGDPRVKYETNAVALYNKLKDSTECKFLSHDDDYHGINPSKDSEDIPEILKFLKN